MNGSISQKNWFFIWFGPLCCGKLLQTVNVTDGSKGMRCTRKNSD